MPVQFSQATRFQIHHGSRYRGRNGKVTRINNSNRASTARCRIDFLLRKMIRVRAITRELSIWARCSVVFFHSLSTFEDVWILRGDILENRRIDTKTLRKNRFWCMGDPVVDIESSPCGIKVACKLREQMGLFVLIPNLPSSKASRYSFWSSSPLTESADIQSLPERPPPWMVWAWPFGKYQMSPTCKSST